METSNQPFRTPLSKVRGLGSAKSGTGHFWKQRLTAIANIPLTIGFICVVLSLVGKDYAAAKAFISQPHVAILLMLFIGAAVFHMWLGMQVIIEDYVPQEGKKLVFLLLNSFFAIVVGLSALYSLLKISLS